MLIQLSRRRIWFTYRFPAALDICVIFCTIEVVLTHLPSQSLRLSRVLTPHPHLTAVPVEEPGKRQTQQRQKGGKRRSPVYS